MGKEEMYKSNPRNDGVERALPGTVKKKARVEGNTVRPHNNTAWEKTSRRKRMFDPLCEACQAQGRLRPATMVHHVQPLEEGGELLNHNNLMSLCGEACHRPIHSVIDTLKQREVVNWSKDYWLNLIGKHKSMTSLLRYIDNPGGGSF